MLSIYQTYCDLRDLTIGKFFIIWFSEPVETRPTNGCSLDGAVVAEIVYNTVLYHISAETYLNNFEVWLEITRE